MQGWPLGVSGPGATSVPQALLDARQPTPALPVQPAPQAPSAPRAPQVLQVLAEAPVALAVVQARRGPERGAPSSTRKRSCARLGAWMHRNPSLRMQLQQQVRLVCCWLQELLLGHWEELLGLAQQKAVVHWNERSPRCL